jgi:predicted nucleic acid-binding protein
MILLDTGGRLAAIDSSQRDHRRAATALRETTEPLLLSPFVLEPPTSWAQYRGSGHRVWL